MTVVRVQQRVLPPRRSIREVLDQYAMDGPVPDLDQLRKDIGEIIAHENCDREPDV